jgi:short-subunit dehydrogenase
MTETSVAEARAMIELPHLAAFAVTRACLPAMLARSGGQILNVTSPASNMVWPNAAAYIAARQTLKSFSDALRLEVAPHGLFVSLVVLGPVESSYWEHNPGSRGRVPKGFAPLGTDQGTQAILCAIERRKRYIVRPARFRLWFAMEAIAPGVTVRG